MKNIIKSIKKVFSSYIRKYNERKNQRVKEICRSIANHFEDNSLMNKFHITEIKVRENKKRILIKIYLGRPGIFVGRKGRTVDSLTETLKEEYGKEIIFSLKQSKLVDWLHYYGPFTMEMFYF